MLRDPRANSISGKKPVEVHSPSTEDAHHTNPWGVAIEPTNLIVLWPPGENQTEAPAFEVALQRLAQQLGREPEVIDRPQPRDSRICWAAVIALDQETIPFVMWLEPMRSLPAETIATLKAEDVRWALGVETILNPSDPHAHLMQLLRLFGRAFHDSPAILDVNKEGWHMREELDTRLLPESCDPDESVLWMIHAISPDAEPSENARVWIYTDGLDRCGLPELELLNLPYPLAGAAMIVLGSIAELVFEDGMPLPGEPFEIGPDMTIVFEGWSDVAAAFPDGYEIDHTGENRGSARAIVCAAGGATSKTPTWPREIVQRIASGEAALYKSRRATQRQARLAHATFEQLAEAFSRFAPGERTPESGPHFLFQAGFATTHGDEDREHLWFEAMKFKGNRIEGRLLNESRAVPQLRRGDVRWIDRNLLSDWLVLTSTARIGPRQADELRNVAPAAGASKPMK